MKKKNGYQMANLKDKNLKIYPVEDSVCKY